MPPFSPMIRRVSAHLRRPRFLRGERMSQPLDAGTILTDRLTLRPHTLRDAPAWYRLQPDDRVVRYLPWPLRDRAESLQHLRDRTHHTRLWQKDDFLAFAMVRDGELIGDVSLHLRSVPAGTRSAEIGWLIMPEEGGRGYASEAADALLDLTLDTLGAKWVSAVMRRDNLPSLNLAKRLGFVQIRSHGADEVEFVVTSSLREHARMEQVGHSFADAQMVRG